MLSCVARLVVLPTQFEADLLEAPPVCMQAGEKEQRRYRPVVAAKPQISTPSLASLEGNRKNPPKVHPRPRLDVLKRISIPKPEQQEVAEELGSVIEDTPALKPIG